jgi:hypothetical protein
LFTGDVAGFPGNRYPAAPDVSADQLADERRAIWQIGSDH